MKVSCVHAGSDSVFRSSSRYQLVVFDRLDAEERSLLGDLRRDPEFYGALRPTVGGGTIKVVGRETALLLFTLREAGALPTYVLEGEGAADRLAEISRLVLDGVLEVCAGDVFVSGPEALPLFMAPAATGAGEGTLSRLSREGLRYAEALRIDDIAPLADRLYAFQRIPVTPRWQRALSDAEATRKLLGLDSRTPRHHRLMAWGKAIKRRSAADWLGWRHRGDGASNPAVAPTYKLYLSPAVEALEAVFETLLDVLPGSRASLFKLGSDAAGLLRPDKLVVYFDDLDSLSRTAAELAERLVGTPAHGVPFTAEIAGDGLLSWGLDPPRSDRGVPRQTRDSWRTWVVRRLATYLIAARHNASGGPPPWRFALERLRLCGVDVERWIPQPTLWQNGA